MSTLGPVMTLLLGWLVLSEHVAVAAGCAALVVGGASEFAQEITHRWGQVSPPRFLWGPGRWDGKPRA